MTVPEPAPHISQPEDTMLKHMVKGREVTMERPIDHSKIGIRICASKTRNQDVSKIVVVDTVDDSNGAG